jgi:hypothetical protein
MAAGYVIGLFLCWMAYFAGDKVERSTASKIPGSKGVRQAIRLIANVSAAIFAASFIYGFWVFDWWIPVIAVGLTPLSGMLYVWFERYASVAIVSVPVLAAVGTAMLGIAFFQPVQESAKENAEHFLKSVQLVSEAHSTSNKNGPGVMSQQELEKFLSLYQRALSEAELTRDDVLDKAHRELKNSYRLYFQKGIELRISGVTNGKLYDEIQGSALMDLWGDWFVKNRRDIKIPR